MYVANHVNQEVVETCERVSGEVSFLTQLDSDGRLHSSFIGPAFGNVELATFSQVVDAFSITIQSQPPYRDLLKGWTDSILNILHREEHGNVLERLIATMPPHLPRESMCVLVLAIGAIQRLCSGLKGHKFEPAFQLTSSLPTV